jgi:hypothetical protein
MTVIFAERRPTMESKLRSRISWKEKMNRPEKPRVVQIDTRWKRWLNQYGHGTMLIATPRLVEGLIRKVPRGRLCTINSIRERLARDFGTTTTCPLTTGIFVRIVAEAANEDLREGRKRVTPFWRLVRVDGSMMDKLPGGPPAQAKLLRKEAHTILLGQGRKLPRVKDFERKLIRF